MKIAIVGFGKQGRSAYEYYANKGYEITVLDQSPIADLPENVDFRIGDNYLDGIERFDLIVRGPRIHPRDIINASSKDILKKVTTNTNEFFKVCPSKNIIGVTGTKGKGTTSTIIAEMLKAAGHRVHFGGNVGIPPLELLKDNIKKDDWVVLELANYQTIDLDYSPHIGVCLMVEPEHLDWHSSMAEYCASKAQMFYRQSAEDIAIYYSENKYSKEIASSGKAHLIPYLEEPGAVIKDGSLYIHDQEIISIKDIKLIGEHNLQNVAAAITAVWQIDPRVKPIKEVLANFGNLPFRLELIEEKRHVKYYDDSFSSNPSATIAALNTIRTDKILILGGKDRGLILDDLMNCVVKHQNTISRILVIGEARDRIADELKIFGFDKFDVLEDRKMKSIVEKACSLAKPGDSVILSPGFPSFDMFNNFEERGIAFNEAVRNL